MRVHEVPARQGGVLQLSAPGDEHVIILVVKAGGITPQGHHVLHVHFGNGKAVFSFIRGEKRAVFRHKA